MREFAPSRVHLQDTSYVVPGPTDRQYWLIVAWNPTATEHNYFVSNAAAGVSVIAMLCGEIRKPPKNHDENGYFIALSY